MASALAIVSKAVFEKEARGLGEGDVWPTTGYASQNKVLATLAAGGDLYLVTVRPGGVLWLVGVLREPQHGVSGWTADANVEAIRDVSAARSQLEFAGGKPLPADAGALGMSLQTPRVLTETDVALLGGAAKPATAVAIPAALPVRGREVEPSSPLAALLDLWAREPSVKLAALIDTASAAARVDPPGLGGKKADAKDAWRAIAEDHAPEHVPALLASLTDVSSGDARDRVAMIADWPPDPRVDLALAGWLDAPPYHATMTKPFYTAVFQLLPRIRDPRAAAVLAGADAKIAKAIAVTMGDWLRAQLAKRLPEIQASSLPATTPNADALHVVAPARPDTREVDDLLAAVYADPDSDAARLVLADALQEQGDPRGELISVQIQRVASPTDRALAAREKELLKLHATSWLGELKGVLAANPTFERGFLAACSIAPRKSPHALVLAGDRTWKTVHTLHGSIELAAHLPGLRTLGLQMWGDSEAKEVEQLCAQLPRLRALELTGTPVALRAIVASPVAARLDRLALSISHVKVPELLTVLAPLSAPLARLEITLNHTGFHPTELVVIAGTTLELLFGPTTTTKGNWSDVLADEAAELVRSFPTVREISVRYRKSLDGGLYASQRARVTDALKAMSLDRWSMVPA